MIRTTQCTTNKDYSKFKLMAIVFWRLSAEKSWKTQSS